MTGVHLWDGQCGRRWVQINIFAGTKCLREDLQCCEVTKRILLISSSFWPASCSKKCFWSPKSTLSSFQSRNNFLGKPFSALTTTVAMKTIKTILGELTSNHWCWSQVFGTAMPKILATRYKSVHKLLCCLCAFYERRELFPHQKLTWEQDTFWLDLDTMLRGFAS